MLGSLPPELTRLLGDLLSLVERPVPLDDWIGRVRAIYRTKARTTRIRMDQALKETRALAGSEATTQDLTAELVARFAGRGGASATTNGLLSALRRACRLAVKWRLLGSSRLEGASWRVKDTGTVRRRHHPRKDVAAVLAWLAERSETWDGARLHALAAVYAFTGVRKMEGLRLRVEDVDLRRGFLFIVPHGDPLKTDGSKAPVPIPRALQTILRPWLGRCNSEWVFPNRGRKSPWTGGTYGRRPTDRLVAAGRAVGVEGFTPLSLRHSLATHLASHWGLSAKQIQMVLRHTVESTQDHYVHPDLENLGALVRDFSFAASARRRTPAKDPRAILRARKRRRPEVRTHRAAI